MAEVLHRHVQMAATLQECYRSTQFHRQKKQAYETQLH